MNDTSSPRDRASRRDLSAEQHYWQLWRQGQRPDLRGFLAARPGLPADEVAAVIAVDQYERWRAGERVAAEDYLPLLPAGPGLDQAGCDIVYGEYLLREQLGEAPALEETGPLLFAQKPGGAVRKAPPSCRPAGPAQNAIGGHDERPCGRNGGGQPR
jgi:hypothetical protein